MTFCCMQPRSELSTIDAIRVLGRRDKHAYYILELDYSEAEIVI